MTDSTTPGDGVHDADPYLTSGAIRYGGGDWVVPSDRVVLADHEDMSGTPLNAFDESHSASSFDIEIDTGEAFVEGSWLGRDTTTTVTLGQQTNNQTVYVGWKKGTSNAVVVGLNSAFDAAWPRLPIWEFDTDGSGVTGTRDVRPLGETIGREVAMSAPGGIKKLIFPNDPGQDDMALVFRSGQEAVTIENDATGEKIVSVGLDGILEEGGSPVITEDEEAGLSVEDADELGGTVSTAHLRAALAAHGYDITNIGTFSATNGNVGGSPVITADGSQNFAGTVNFGSYSAINLADPTGPQHAVTRSYLSDNYIDNSEHYTDSDARNAVTTAEIPGTIDMGQSSIRDLPDPSGPQQPGTQSWVNDNFIDNSERYTDPDARNAVTNSEIPGTIDMGQSRIIDLADPNGPRHAMTNQYSERNHAGNVISLNFPLSTVPENSRIKKFFKTPLNATGKILNCWYADENWNPPDNVVPVVTQYNGSYGTTFYRDTSGAGGEPNQHTPDNPIGDTIPQDTRCSFEIRMNRGSDQALVAGANIWLDRS